MKQFKVMFDNEVIEGIDVMANDMDAAKIYVNVLVNHFESYGFTVVEEV